MAYPTVNVNTTNLDVGTDNPALARTDLLDLTQKFNLLRPLPADLAASTGSSLIGFDFTLNYVAGTIGAELHDLGANVKALAFLAKGDGATDDYAAIQAAITYAFLNKLGTVRLPKGTYNISKPLYLYGSDNYINSAVRLVGAGIDSTIIQKTGNVTTADGSWYASVDSVVILTPYPAPVSATPVTGTYNASISDLTVSGYATTPNTYGVYTKDDFGQLKCARWCIKNTVTSFRTDANMWLSSFENMSMHPTQNGFWMNSSGTSNHLKNTYVLGGAGVGYNLQGQYSSADCIACDGFTGTPYNFRFAQWTVNGLGVECAAATGFAINALNGSNITVNSAVILAPNVFNCGADSILALDAPVIGDGTVTARTGALWFVAGAGQLSIANMVKSDTFATASTGYASLITKSMPGTGSYGVNALQFTGNTPAAGMTSQSMKWYEEGTWTPADDGASSGVLGTWAVVAGSAKYTRVGRLVTAEVSFSGTAIGLTPATGYYRWSGLPFNLVGIASGRWSSLDVVSAPITGEVVGAGTNKFWINASQSGNTCTSITLQITYTV